MDVQPHLYLLMISLHNIIIIHCSTAPLIRIMGNTSQSSQSCIPWLLSDRDAEWETQQPGKVWWAGGEGLNRSLLQPGGPWRVCGERGEPEGLPRGFKRAAAGKPGGRPGLCLALLGTES